MTQQSLSIVIGICMARGASCTKVSPLLRQPAEKVLFTKFFRSMPKHQLDNSYLKNMQVRSLSKGWQGWTVGCCMAPNNKFLQGKLTAPELSSFDVLPLLELTLTQNPEETKSSK